MSILITADDLAIGYKGQAIYSGINLTLKPGVTAIIGRNGVGKSTLIWTLTGSLQPTAGIVRLGNKEIGEYSRKELAKSVAIVSTEQAMAGGLRLCELVALGRIPYTGRMGRLTVEDRRIVEDAMKRVGIAHKKDSFVAELSDGERQKGMIARGLVQSTPIIIMDEPFSFLDVASRLEIMALIQELALSGGKAILYSSHEVTEALKSSDRIWAFTSDGIEDGSPEQLIERGTMNHIFPNKNVKFDKDSREFVWIGEKETKTIKLKRQ